LYATVGVYLQTKCTKNKKKKSAKKELKKLAKLCLTVRAKSKHTYKIYAHKQHTHTHN